MPDLLLSSSRILPQEMSHSEAHANGMLSLHGRMMDLSVVIPTYNRSRLLQRTLKGLSEQATDHLIREVLIVSDGSTDDTLDVVRGFEGHLPIRFIGQAKSGVSAARNRGIAEASGNIILLLDDDVVPTPRLIAEHIEFHRLNSAREFVLLGYVTWLPELQISPFMRWYGEYGALFGYALLVEDMQVDRKFLYSCNISFKLDFLRQVGGFNENLTVYEDHELGYRLAKQGMRMFFKRAALGYHNQTFAFQQACDRMQRYSEGIQPFLATEAGIEMTRSESSWKKYLKQLGAGRFVHILKPLKPLVDSHFRLPPSLYRLLYWYGATLPAIKATKRNRSQMSGS